MTLLEELKQRWERTLAELKAAEDRVEDLSAQMNELDIAVCSLEEAAPEDPAPIVNSDEGWELEPSPAELFEAEKSEAREQLEREDDASEFAEPDALLTALENDHIVERQPFAMLDEQTCEPVSPFVEPERPALNEQMQDERELTAGAEPGDGYAPVTDEWVETAPNTLAEYTPPTNPEADALAKAHDYYSPEKVADRNRFNPWGGVSHLFGKPKVDA